MIKTLYVNGDSWTFGQELKDDKLMFLHTSFIILGPGTLHKN